MKIEDLLLDANSLTIEGKFKISEVLHGVTPTILRVNSEAEAIAECVIPDEQFALESVLIKCLRPDAVLAFLRGDPFIEGGQLPLAFRSDEPGDDVGVNFLMMQLIITKGQKLIIGVTSRIEQEVMVVLSGTAVRATG